MSKHDRTVVRTSGDERSLDQVFDAMGDSIALAVRDLLRREYEWPEAGALCVAYLEAQANSCALRFDRDNPTVIVSGPEDALLLEMTIGDLHLEHAYQYDPQSVASQIRRAERFVDRINHAIARARPYAEEK